MRIRTQLLVLVLATIAPVAILATVAILRLWDVQRASYDQRFLERVRAVRLALDTEIEATLRTLRALGNSGDLDADERLPSFEAGLRTLLANQPMWHTIGLMGPDGAAVVRADSSARGAGATLDRATFDEVARTNGPVVSDLVVAQDGRQLFTFLAVPVGRGPIFKGVVYVGVEHRGWLEFLRGYPIAEQATLTLNDRNGLIIARTLNDERWAGKPSSPGYWSRTQGKEEETFRNVGLEGQRFYTAFSRLRTTSWVLGTGVPQEEVEEQLEGSTRLIAGAVIGAALIATVLAILLGGRIATAVTGLARSARSVARLEQPPARERSPIDEVETVNRALDEAALLLRARDQSAAEALARQGELRAEAERASKAKDEFLAMLGHELRNPISAISAAAALLERSEDDADLGRRAREVVQRQLRHLTEIVNDMLDVTRLTSGKVVLRPKTLDLAALVRHMVEVFEAARRSTHLRVVCDLAPARVVADETRLAQVIGNLLENACKYTPQGGRVDVRVAVEGDQAVLEVRDTGSGIAPELLPTVFDVFAQGKRTLDRAQGGLGLGLTVVRRLVELHGGSVCATSGGPGQGSRFVVRLPAAEAAEVEVPGLGERVGPVPRRIVLVEDEPDSRESIALLLRLHGHEVTVAADGPSGIEAIVTALPDVALVDLGLPGFDGAEVARRVRATPGGRSIRMVALTGYGMPEFRELAGSAGFDRFLVKPFDVDAFEAAIADPSPAAGP